MTAIVGIWCRDGIVLGTDSRATFTSGLVRTIEQPTDHKMRIISGKLMLAGTGQVGLGQRFARIVEKAYEEEKIFKGAPVSVATALCQQAVRDFASTDTPKGQYGALLAFPVEDRLQLCEFAASDFQPELKDAHLWYCSMGSSQPITDPFLGFFRGIFWRDGPPSVSEGVFVTLWTLRLAIELNPGGVGGEPVIGVLEKAHDGKLTARQLSKDELGEHFDAVEAVAEHLRAFRDTHRATTGKGFPDIPGQNKGAD
jgi:hypothetical protein